MPNEQMEVVSKGLAHCNESFPTAGGCLTGASSPESVGELWLWQASKVVVEADFNDFVGAKAV